MGSRPTTGSMTKCNFFHGMAQRSRGGCAWRYRLRSGLILGRRTAELVKEKWPGSGRKMRLRENAAEFLRSERCFGFVRMRGVFWRCIGRRGRAGTGVKSPRGTKRSNLARDLSALFIPMSGFLEIGTCFRNDKGTKGRALLTTCRLSSLKVKKYRFSYVKTTPRCS